MEATLMAAADEPMDKLRPLLSLSLHIIPIRPRSKVPIPRDWVGAATGDPAAVLKWATQNPGCNWGVVTGRGSGVFVIDVDKKGGGVRTWARLVKRGGVPETLTVKTGGGGQHLYFKYPRSGEVRNSAGRVGVGVDVRGEGGQVLVPPSTHPGGGEYEWAPGRGPGEVRVARAPAWLLAAVGGPAGGDGGTPLGGELVPGERNNQLYTQALKMARTGALQEVTLAAMVAWVQGQGQDTPLEEVEATVASAYKYADRERPPGSNLDSAELSDSGNAVRLVDAAAGKVLYTRGLGWHVWSGRHWYRDAGNIEITGVAQEAMDAWRDDILAEVTRSNDRGVQNRLFRLAQWATQSRNRGRLDAMVEVAKPLPGVAIDPSGMDGPGTEFLLNCANGVLDLKSGELREHDPALRISSLSPTEYRPRAKCPTFMETLNLAFAGDRELIGYLQRCLGYSLSASTSETAFFILWGPEGRNGKSTIMETVGRVLGEDYSMMSDGKVITSGKSADNYILSSLASLVGVRLVSMNELEDAAVLEENLIKQITGGDTIQAKLLYNEPFRYVPTFKIFMRTNNKPIIRGTNEAIWRRVKCIPFLHPIPAEKVRLRHEVDAELAGEHEGILAWMVRGFQDWVAGGLSDPPSVRATVMEYREASDVVAQFFSECVVDDPAASTPRKTLYMAFRSWYEEQGMRYCMTAEKFSRRVADKLNQHNDVVRRGGKGHQAAVWRGVRLSQAVEGGAAFMLG